MDAEGGTVGDLVPGVKSGDIRILAIFDKGESKFLPGVPTATPRDFSIEAGTARAFSVPAGTPKDVVGVLAASIQKAMQDPEHKKKMEEQGLDLRYMDATQLVDLLGSGRCYPEADHRGLEEEVGGEYFACPAGRDSLLEVWGRGIIPLPCHPPCHEGCQRST